MLNLRVQKLGDATVLHCVGQIVFPHATVLYTFTLQEPRVSCLVVDLADVTTMDAAGLGVLVSLRSWATKSGRTLKLMNVNSKIAALLELTNLRSVFDICSATEMLDLLCRAVRTPEMETFLPSVSLVQGFERSGNESSGPSHSQIM